MLKLKVIFQMNDFILFLSATIKQNKPWCFKNTKYWTKWTHGSAFLFVVKLCSFQRSIECSISWSLAAVFSARFACFWKVFYDKLHILSLIRSSFMSAVSQPVWASRSLSSLSEKVLVVGHPRVTLGPAWCAPQPGSAGGDKSGGAEKKNHSCWVFSVQTGDNGI